MKTVIYSNFDMLCACEGQLWRLGALAERYFAEDPNTSLLKLRQFSELLAQSLAARTGFYVDQEESQYELIRRLQNEAVLPREIKQIFDQVRVTAMQQTTLCRATMPQRWRRSNFAGNCA